MKAVSLEGSMEAVVAGGMESGICGMVSFHSMSRMCSIAWPSRLQPRHIYGDEARLLQPLKPMPHNLS